MRRDITVKLLNPQMCMGCRFHGIAEVKMPNGDLKRMIYCRRLDCDNWDYDSMEPAEIVQVIQDDIGG